MPETTVTFETGGTTNSPTPRFSVVVPAYNEEKDLPRLIGTIDAARASYGRPEAIEVVVADNLSTDGTRAVAAARGCRVVRVEKRVMIGTGTGKPLN